jgi:hypothetical protein
MGKELILCAAIHYDDGIFHYHQPLNIKTGFVISGYRHCQIYSAVVGLLFNKNINMLEENECKIKFNKVEGFLSNLNNFYTREQALIIAEKTKQILKDNIIGNQLLSENLY